STKSDNQKRAVEAKVAMKKTRQSAIKDIFGKTSIDECPCTWRELIKKLKSFTVGDTPEM
ncbi:MAG: hypothetical protein OEZ01_18415, partial [Candidatus Heimdallarchaeota archaeon]|nr:hypothetical protein [Candidatus Heimdallarchaeota archaeon]